MSELEALKVMVLLSGGVDSTACIGYYIKKKYQIYALFINYGQQDIEKESVAATAVADYYNIPLYEITVDGFKDTYLVGMRCFYP